MSYVRVRDSEVTQPHFRDVDTHKPESEHSFEILVRGEVDKLRQQAVEEGRAIGVMQGEAAGKQTAETEVQSIISALNCALKQIELPLKNIELEISEMVTDLAFILARHVISAELKSNTDSVKSLVVQLVREAAAERKPNQNIIVRLNPADVDYLSIDDFFENAQLVRDDHMERGGAVVEIISPSGDPIDKIEWDATIETRLQTIRKSLALSEEAAQS